MPEILQYDFFQNALLGGIMIALIASILGVFIIMRKEANITHSIANFLFLGIAVSLLFQGEYYVYAGVFAFVGSVLIFWLEKTKFITKESTKEIISQGGMAGGIFTVSLMSQLQFDINSLLFGSILAIQISDLWLIFALLCIVGILFFLFGRNFFAVIINENIAKSSGIPVNIYNFFFLFLLSLFIALSVKIFGILLIGAFLVIPANSAKLIAHSLKQVLIFSSLIALTGVIGGLFFSYYLEASTGATIVLTLLSIFLVLLILKKYYNG